MPEIRKDTIRDQWVGLAVDKALAPQKFPSVRKKMRLEHSDFCPFCEGNEDATPPEVFAMRAGGGVSNGINWDLRLIPSKFTTFHSDEEFISSDSVAMTCSTSSRDCLDRWAVPTSKTLLPGMATTRTSSPYCRDEIGRAHV